ncbi:MAG: trypsin-like peptidase domain-containing protein [Planctomycetota bacterium]|nr:trypsin-like peptidase domain-containing protein [Planctomycetota bacterium]
MIPLIVILLTATLQTSSAAVGDGTRGQDPFDDVASIDEMRTLEGDLRAVALRLRPTVVLIRIGGGRMGGGSSGTGVLISSDGLVATCGHVGGSAGVRVDVTLSDGTELHGKTLGQANIGKLDCGLIQLNTEGRDLPSAPLGTSTGLASGDWLVSMGFTQGPPDEPRPSLVRIGRVLRITPEEMLFDAPIDAGDSGGPSFNLRGEVVAINSRCGQSPWENAATPVDRLRERMWEFRDGIDESLLTLENSDDSERGVRTNFARNGSENGRMAVQRTLPFDEIVANARASMLNVMDGKAARVCATVIDGDGHAVTKRSQLPSGWQDGDLKLESAAGDHFTARVIGSDGPLDLAVLKIDNCTIAPIQWTHDAHIAPGQVLLTPRLGQRSAALGFAAIESRESDRDWSSGPYLGVRTDEATTADRELIGTSPALKVVEVVPGAAAAAAGVEVGDLLLSIDGKELSGRMGLRRMIADRAVGDRVALEIARGEERLHLAATLAKRPAVGRTKGTTRGNTTTAISDVSTGFGSVLAHDGIVWPEQCGGPIVNLDGQAVGLNIARFDRTATHALSVENLMAAVEKIIARSGTVETHPASAADPAPR